MSGLLHYLSATMDPMTNLGFAGALGQLISSLDPAWWLLFLTMFLIGLLPTLVVWIIYLVNPARVHPPLPDRPMQVEPLVSVVIAGRNESATIGQVIRGALLCGYGKLEVIFVDDNSSDDSIAVARHAALGVLGSGKDANRVRIFPSPRRNGKASSLNIAIRMARGEFIAVTDADSVIQYGSIQHWLLPFADPCVGAVAGNIRLMNMPASLVTRLQELEYAMRFSLNKYILASFNIIPVIPGMGGMFRAEILRCLHGYDTGLGDDTDMSQMVRKQQWKLGFSFGAVVHTAVPVTRHHLWSQRARWSRNSVKIRLSKHREFFVLGRFGLATAIVVLRLLVGRTTVNWLMMIGTAILLAVGGPFTVPEVIGTLYWVAVLFVLIRLLIARDICGTPTPLNFCLVPLYPFYMLWWTIPKMCAEMSELFRIGAHHHYVPDHVWNESPWW
jgi:cellulose synthase/poly-beta-1,6-N-acetylglucosamine synthase-like glycosyltransferase